MISCSPFRTELCAFSEYRIYPGHGQKFIRRDGQPVTLSSSKCKRLLINRKKPAKLMWTQAWRRLNKKGKDEGVVRKKARRVVKAVRAIVGASLDDIKQKKAAVAKAQKAAPATEAALKEVKDRTKAKTTGVKSVHGHMQGAVPKHQKSGAFNARGGTRR
jgi:large subunit ribosomal protein L24e